MFRRRRRIWSVHVVVLQRTAKKCTKIYNARAQLLFCSSNLLFGAVFVAVVVVVCLRSLFYKTLRPSVGITSYHEMSKALLGQSV